MKRRNCIINVAIGLAILGAMPVNAQKELTVTEPIIAVATENETIGSEFNLVNLDIAANVDVDVTSSESWATIVRSGKNIYVRVEANKSQFDRQTLITVADKNGAARTRYIYLKQGRSTAADYIDGDVELTISDAKTNTYQPGGGEIIYSYDNDYKTNYHSKWFVAISDENPAILEYFFPTTATKLDYLTYIPREHGGNGSFGRLEIWYRTASDADYVKLGDYNFEERSTATSVDFPETLQNPRAVKFVVNSGYADLASCGEMKFFYRSEPDPEFGIFTDNLYTALRPEVTQAIIDTLTNPFVRDLAQEMLDGNYSLDYRVSSHECLLSPQALSAQWSTPGKLYDQIQGVTGIMMRPGRTIVAASGIPAGSIVGLQIIGWTVPDGQTYKSESYSLHNGINIIDRGESDWNGLAYVTYYDDEPEKYANDTVKVHIINGVVNGYLTPDQSNAEMEQLLQNAAYTTIDLMGSRVHSVWEPKALLEYATNQYRRYLNVLDTLIAWEHRLIGLEKYGRIPKNKTLAYVNYSYYMYQGGMGVTFKYDTQDRCCSPDNIMYKDDDVVWGLSHEWGHQHQMQPYFCWAGLGESSNNMNSCYNVLHMGYTGTRISQGWERARNVFLDDGVDTYKSGDEIKTDGAGCKSEARARAYHKNDSWSWNAELQELARSMVDTIVPSQAENLERSISINEVYVEINLAPLFMLHCHFTPTLPDFTPDLYEVLRTTDSNDDKYAILASAQNGVSGKYAAYKAAYPNSAWITHNYILENSTTWQNSVPYIFNYVRNASKLCGYNLYPYFEKWGFFRLIANVIDDYGDKFYAMTQEMKDEFRADMDLLVTEGYTDKDGNVVKLKEMPDDMIESISTADIPKFSTPEIPN